MGAHRKDYDYAVKMYNDGLSIQDVASYYGIGRQAMYMILKRRDVKFRSQRKFGKDNHFYRGGVIKKGDSNDLLERAIEKGVVVRLSECDECGESGMFSDGRTSIQAHHPDYNKPLDVVWLCQKCHHELHKTMRPIGRIDE